MSGSTNTPNHKIAFYQSAFSKEPAEIDFIKSGATLREWLSSNVRGFDPDNKNISYSQPLDMPVNSDVSAIYTPAGKAIGSIFKPIFKLLGMNTQKPKTQQSIQRGDDIEISSVQANQAKYGSVVRELFGTYKIFPDYLTPPHRYFLNKKDHWTEMLVCVGVGEFDLPLTSVRIGDTPAAAFGSNVQIEIFPPGANVSVNSCSHWWHSVPEVGGTSDGSSGLPLRPSYTAESSAPGGNKVFSGVTVESLSGSFPSSWSAGLKLDIDYQRTYELDGNKITGPISDINIAVGDRISLGGDISGSYTVSAVQPDSAATFGTPSKLIGHSDMSLNYAASNATFNVTSGRYTALLALTDDYASDSSIVDSLNAQIAVTALSGLVIFSRQSGNLVITELPAYSSSRISIQNIANAALVFGDISLTNSAAIIGTAASAATESWFTLKNFSQPAGASSLSIKKYGGYFELVGVSGSVITVQRRKKDGSIDWSGFVNPFTLSDSLITLDASEVESGWQGWFDVQPANERSTEVQLDIVFPQGLYATDKKGRPYRFQGSVTVQWRRFGGVNIETRFISYSESSLNQIAFTETITLPQGQWQIRIKRNEAEYNGTNGVNKIELFGLRSKIIGAPTRYPLFTTMAIRIKGSEAASAASDEMISCIPTRKLNGVPTRSIKDAAEYIARSQIFDDAELIRLQSVWAPRNDTFDFSFEKQSTVKQALNIALGAGMAEVIVKDGALTPVRDSKRNPLIRAHSFSAQNTTSPIIRSVEMIGDDETYGIDVEYMSSETWRTETVECRKTGLIGAKIEKMKVDGVTNRTKAWRIGMRELMRKRYQRTTITASTELDALNAHYNDMTFFTEDVPTYGQSALIVEQYPSGVYRVSEPIQWVDGADMVAALRQQNGELGALRSISKIDAYTIKASPWLGQAEVMQTVLVGTREKIGISAIVTDIKASGTGAKISAAGYVDKIYDHDNLQADN